MPNAPARGFQLASGLGQVVQRLLVPGLLAGFWLAYFWPLLIRQDYLIPYDIIEQHYMFQAFVHRSLVEGQAPWWAPHILGGYPIAADPLTMLFYPPTWIMHLLAWGQPLLPYVYLEWLAALHVLWAASGTYLLARTLSRSRAGGLLAALTYAYNPFFALHLPHLSALVALSWLPWILLAFRRAFSRRAPLWVAVAASAFGTMALAGHALTTLQIGYLLLGLTLLAAWHEWTRHRRRTATTTPGEVDGAHRLRFSTVTPEQGLLAARASLRAAAGPLLAGLAALALGTGLAMVQLLPSWELSGHTERADFPYEEAVVSSIQPHWLLTALLPGLFSPDGPAPYWGSGDPAETNVYAGLLPLFFAALGATRARPEERRTVALLVGGGALALVLALGQHTWLYRLAYDVLPGVDRVRRPANYVPLFQFALALLAAFGVRALERDSPTMETGRLLLRWTGRALLALLILLGFSTLMLANAVGQSTLDVWRGVVDGLVFAAFVLAASAAVLLARTSWGLSLRVVLVLLLAVTALDLATASAGASYKHHRMRPDSYIGLDWAGDPNAPIVRLLQASQQRDAPDRFRILPRQVGSIWQNGPLVWQLDSAWGYSVLWLTAYRTLFDAATADPSSPLFDLMNVRYVLTPGPIEETFPGLAAGDVRPIYDGSPRVFENPSAFPRVWVASEAVLLPREQQIAYLSAHAPALRDLVVLDQDAAVPPQAAPGAGTPATAPGTAQIVHYENTRVVVEARLARDAFVVLLDTAYPGWEARIDGERVPLYRADHAFRAVWVPAGEHRIEFRFTAPTIRNGAVVSGASVLALAGLVLVSAARGRTLRSAWHYLGGR